MNNPPTTIILNSEDLNQNDVQLELDFIEPEPALLTDLSTDFSIDSNTIDLSGISIGASGSTVISNWSSQNIGNITITGGAGGGGYMYGNVTTSPGAFNLGDWNNTKPEIVVSDGDTEIGLLATLKQWSKVLGLPLSIQNIENKHEMVQTIYKDWQQAAENGNLEECKKIGRAHV